MQPGKETPQKGGTIKKRIVNPRPSTQKKRGPKTHMDIKKEKEFELYTVWRSLPPMMIRPVKGTAFEVADKLGIDDETIRELMGISSQTEFAKRYKVDQATLTKWNRLISKRDTLEDIRNWAKYLTKNVMLSMYQNAMTNGRTSFKDRENFLKVIEQWSEKLDIKHDVKDTLADIIKAGLGKKDAGDGTGD